MLLWTWAWANSLFGVLSGYQSMIRISVNCRRKLRSQTSDNMDRWKSRGGKSQRREEKKKEDQRRERVRRKKMQVREKVEKSRNTVFFQWFGAPDGRKVGSLKAAGAESSGQMRDEKLHAIVASALRSPNARKTSRSEHFWKLRCGKSGTPMWREADLEVKTHKACQDVAKERADVARNRFGSQNVQSTPFSEHFWKLRCRKSARRCGAKHISKSTCEKHTTFGHVRTTFWRSTALHCTTLH